MKGQRGSPLDSLRRRILALLGVGLFTVVVPGSVLMLFEQDEARTRDRITEFHGPTLAATQEALLALDDLRLEPAPPAADRTEWERRQRLLFNQLEQRLRRIAELQDAFTWAEADATVRRLRGPLATIAAALDIGAEPQFGTLPLTVARLPLEQLRLLHQDEQANRLRGLATRDRVFYRFVLPVLVALLAGATLLAWQVWRGIRQSLVAEGELRDGLVREISERQQAYDARLRAEAELRLKDSAIATSINGIVIIDTAGAIVYANPAFLAMWRLPDLAALAALPTRDLWHYGEGADDRAAGMRSNGWSGEVTAIRGDGTRFPALLSSTAVRDDAGRMTHEMNSFVDLTDARAMQEQLVQSQKLESVGRLAGGIAHDFNNLLLVIKGYLEMALAAIPPDSETHHDLLEVDRAANSAAMLTAQLLTFSRRQIIAPVVLDLNEAVHHVYGMLKRVLGEDVTLSIATAPNLWRVRFDPGQAEQILMNLAVNARDAMPSGGRLTIETANVFLGEDYVRDHHGTAVGEYVMLAVSDTGAGMSAETLAHVFEPFYTTKVSGRGTGLGLAIIHGAVSQNGGRIELYSEPGHGTSFKIYLPRTLETDAAPLTSPARKEPPRGHETILLVEDDTAVRTLAVRLLERQGYRVFAFDGASAVLDWLPDAREPIHLLLSDVIMEGMNGKELADRVTSLRPDTKVLYVSGYTANVIVQHGVLKAGMEFLAKPYTRDALATRVREVLDRTN